MPRTAALAVCQPAPSAHGQLDAAQWRHGTSDRLRSAQHAACNTQQLSATIDTACDRPQHAVLCALAVWCLRYQLRRTMRAALMGYSLCKVAFALLIHFAARHKCTLKRTATLVWLRAVGASTAQVSQGMLLHRSLRSSGSSAEGLKASGMRRMTAALRPRKRFALWPIHTRRRCGREYSTRHATCQRYR